MNTQNETKKERDERKKNERLARRTIWGALGLVVVIAAVFAFVYLSQPKAGTISTGEVAPVVADDHVVGDRDNYRAVLIEYSDFQCPACAATEPLIKELREEYAEQGLLFVYRHYPLAQHNKALLAAKATEAAANQDKFWEMHGRVFAGQADWSRQTVTEAAETFRGYAAAIGLDLRRYDADVDSQAAAARVKRDLDSGNRAKVAGTPTFFLNGQEVSVRTDTDFRAAIEAALATSEGDSGTTTNVTGSTIIFD